MGDREKANRNGRNSAVSEEGEEKKWPKNLKKLRSEEWTDN